MHAEIREIKEGESYINPYGSKNEAEFLCVVSEYFFKQPELLEEKHPELYGMLERMFRVPDELPKNQ
jgi:Mlc titration factor MtfA (ptsG expression regulator)